MHTTHDPDELLDLSSFVGQRTASFRFYLYNFITREIVREVTPYRDSVPTLTHDTSRTIVRQISGLRFDPVDTAALNTINSRLVVQMIYPGRAPIQLGVFMFIDQTRLISTGGTRSDCVVTDSMFIVDQQMERSYSAGVFDDASGLTISFTNCEEAIRDLLINLPVVAHLESTPFYTIGAWTAGTSRGSALGDIAIDGDYFAPWFDRFDVMRFIRAFDPTMRLPSFDFDRDPRIIRDSISRTDNLLIAPNRFIVISNGDVSGGTTLPVVGQFDVPASAPHSIVNRGFVIPEVIDWQVDYTAQANTIAANFAQRQSLFETVEFETPPDPRHDAYDVFVFEGELWLELSWSMELIEGGTMSHMGRKAYR